MEPLDDSDDQTRRAKTRLGERLVDKWMLEELIGMGGMAAVYAARHRNGKRVAIKILHRDPSLGDESRARFLREGLVANAVGHKGAVSVLDEDVTEDGSPFFVMDLFEGETLDSRLRRKGPLAAEEVLSATYYLLDVLAAAHEKGIVHRDIKPENVFLTKDASVKVLDFGIAQLREPNTATTKVGHTMGTPSFMAPEQARGRWDEVDARSDLWSVGATMFTLLTNRHVHEAQTMNEVLLGAMTVKAKPISLLRPDLSPEVCALVDKALAFAPADRWQSAREMQLAIGGSCDGLGCAPEDGARAPTLAAASVRTPDLAAIAAQLDRPLTATTARPTVRTSESEIATPARGRTRAAIAILAATGVMAIASWVAVNRAGDASRAAGPRSAAAGSSIAPPPVLAPPLPAAEPAPSALARPSPAPPATGDPTASPPTPAPTPSTPPRARSRHVASATPPPAPPSPPPGAGNPLDRRH